MTKRLLTGASVLALALAWTVAPASAIQHTVKDDAERAKDKVENKMERAADKTEDKAERAKDKAGNAVDKTKAKAADVKDTLKNKLSGADGNDDVRQAQQALQDQGVNPGPIDGLMGPQTRAALREYQKKENLKVTGRLDSATKDRLLAGKTATSSPSASPSTTSAPPTTGAGAADTTKQRQTR
jgi:peptidoglycan hydrolase-like protein with peptidoglycan-binding domain